jgi:hypothetical protein
VVRVQRQGGDQWNTRSLISSVALPTFKLQTPFAP